MRELHFLLYAGRSRSGEAGHSLLGAGYTPIQHTGARHDEPACHAGLRVRRNRTSDGQPERGTGHGAGGRGIPADTQPVGRLVGKGARFTYIPFVVSLSNHALSRSRPSTGSGRTVLVSLPVLIDISRRRDEPAHLHHRRHRSRIPVPRACQRAAHIGDLQGVCQYWRAPCRVE